MIDVNEKLKKCKTVADLTGGNGLFKKIMKGKRNRKPGSKKKKNHQ